MKWTQENLRKLKQEATESASYWYSASMGRVGKRFNIQGDLKERRLNRANRYKDIAQFLSKRIED